jgi:hypothetical protein
LKTDGPVDKKLLEKLPLAGIRVLDMTRVLAGVGDYLLEFKIWIDSDRYLAILHPDTWRPWVCYCRQLIK